MNVKMAENDQILLIHASTYWPRLKRDLLRFACGFFLWKANEIFCKYIPICCRVLNGPTNGPTNDMSEIGSNKHDLFGKN